MLETTAALHSGASLNFTPQSQGDDARARGLMGITGERESQKGLKNLIAIRDKLKQEPSLSRLPGSERGDEHYLESESIWRNRHIQRMQQAQRRLFGMSRCW